MEHVKYDVFISYSRADYVDAQKRVIPGNVVSKVKDALTEAGITFWFDEKGINHGENFATRIVASIKASYVFIFLSTQSANRSAWTSKEIACADELRKHIIPVRIDKSPYNETTMFRIADLDYIDYYANAEKGLEELVVAVKTAIAAKKEEEAKCKAEEEARRAREEQEKRKQREEQESQRARQVQTIRDEMSMVDAECDELEKKLLQQRHMVEMTTRELNRKKKRLEALKVQLKGVVDEGPDSTSFGHEFHQTDAQPAAEPTPLMRDLPSSLKKWNWGAFLFTWIWGVCNGVYWPLIFIIPYIGWAAALVGCVYLGLKGNELAWNGKKNWPSIEVFEETQQKWSRVALMLLGGCILIILVGALLSQME